MRMRWLAGPKTALLHVYAYANKIPPTYLWLDK